MSLRVVSQAARESMAVVSEQVKTGRAGSFPSEHSPAVLILASVMLLVASGLRAFRIDAQSLWYDEGVSAVMASRGLVEITASSAADIHPPLYYYVLHFWTALVGTGELSLRWLSLIAGVLTVATVYSIGQRLANRNVAGFASAFAAVSPLLVYYSQEARMYSQVALLAALSFRLFIPLSEWLRRPFEGRFPIKIALAYLLASMAMLYSHYYAFTILLAQNLLVAGFVLVGLGGSMGGRHSPLPCAGTVGRTRTVRSGLGSWIGLQVALVVLYLPWLMVSLGQLQSWPSISDSLGLRALLDKVFVAFSFGLAADAAVTPARTVVFLLLLAALALSPLIRDRSRGYPVLLVLAYAAVPVVTMYALSLRRPMYNPKFLLLAVPAYALLLGLGLETLRRAGVRLLKGKKLYPHRFASLVAGSGPLPPRREREGEVGSPRSLAVVWSVVVVVVVFSLVTYATAWSLAASYFDPKYARDDYRSLVAAIASRSGPNDAIVLNAPGQADIFGYYYRGTQAVYPLPRQRPPEPVATRNELHRITGEHSRIWLVLWATEESDPNSIVERWLDQNAFKVDNRWFGGPRLAEYAVSTRQAVVEAAGVAFQDGVRLQSYSLVNPMVEAGQPLNLSLSWQAERKVAGRYVVFVHIIDDKEFLWGQTDSEPVGGSAPTTTWRPGVEVVDKRGVQVLPGTPPGKYRLELGLYQPDSGQRLQLLDAAGRPVADRYLFGSLQVASPKSPPSVESLKIAHPLSATFGGAIRLAGFGLNPLGRDSEGAVFATQDIAQLTLIWQAQQRVSSDWSIRLSVRDRFGREVLSKAQPVTDGRYPTSRWSGGEIVRDQLKLALKGLAAGEYGVSLAVTDGAGNPVAASIAASAPAKSLQMGPMVVR